MFRQVIQVTPTIWCVRRPSYLTCSYIVRSPQGIILVDAGMDSNGNDILHGLATIGESIASVRALLLTHWHNDHAAGGAYLQRTCGAPVYYHEADAAYFTRRTARLGLRGWLSEIIPEWGLLVLFKGLLGEATPRAVSATHLVQDGQTILDLFTVLETPGHTAGHVAYYYRPEKVLFAGDALAIIDEQVHFMARPVTLDTTQARTSMIKCLQLEIDVVCPGHRQPLTTNVRAACAEMLEYLQQGKPWPLLG